ncbi:MAG: DNA repair protein RecO [Acidobacteria bacterium]|nr:DNA repair protein RecO [Acidobacteriota bacterium]
METFRGEAYVISRTPLTESSFVVTLFTRDWGIIKAVAKGARRLKSPFRGTLEPFNRVAVLVARKEHSSLGQIRSSDLVDGALDLYESWPRAAALAAMQEVLQRGLPEGSQEEDTFRLVATAIQNMREGVSPFLVWLYFGVWFLRLHGVMPSPDRCVGCGADPRPLLYEAGHAGWLCDSCRGDSKGQGQPVGPKAERMLRQILKLPINGLPPESGRGQAAWELRSMVYLALAAFLGRPLATRQALENAYGDDARSD